jgi:hypothetical protein
VYTIHGMEGTGKISLINVSFPNYYTLISFAA